MHILIQQSKKGIEGGGEARVAKGVAKKWSSEKLVKRENFATTINTLLYMSMTVRGGGRRRKREGEDVI